MHLSKAHHCTADALMPGLVRNALLTGMCTVAYGPYAQRISIAQMHRRCIQASHCTADALTAGLTLRAYESMHRCCICATLSTTVTGGYACSSVLLLLSPQTRLLFLGVAPLMQHPGPSLHRRYLNGRPRAKRTHAPARAPPVHAVCAMHTSRLGEAVQCTADAFRHVRRLVLCAHMGPALHCDASRPPLGASRGQPRQEVRISLPWCCHTQ